ncbi:hypothetical protein Aperf_G00000094766 [Anoplocephala perfoliata]
MIRNSLGKIYLLRGFRRAPINAPVSQIATRPIEQVLQLVERSSQSLRDEIWNMQRSLFSLEPLAALDAAMADMLRTMSAIKHHGARSTLDFPRDFFEVDQDGKLHFKVYFNAKGFKPEDITILTDKDILTIKARRSVERGNALMEEFVGRSIPLPSSVDSKNLKTTLTSDEVLVIEAPVNVSECNKDKTIQPSAEDSQIALTNKDGLEVLTLEDGSKKMHLELSIGEHFKPSDVKVWAKEDKVYVGGLVTKEEKTEDSLHSERHDFYQVFTTPKPVDTDKLKAELVDGRLVVEAPLLSECHHH